MHSLRKGSQGLNTLTVQAAKKIALESPQDHITLLKKVAALYNNQKPQLYEALVPDFSLYFRPALRPITCTQLLHRLVQVNPGRVLLSYELLMKEKAFVTDELLSSVISSLVQEENPVVALERLKALAKQTHFYLQCVRHSTATVLSHWIETDNLAVVGAACDLLPVNFLASFAKQLLGADLDTDATANARIAMVLIVDFLIAKDAVTVESAIETLKFLGKQEVLVQSSFEDITSRSKKLSLAYVPTDVTEIRRKIAKYAEDKRLIHKNVELCALVIEAHGIHLKDLEKAVNLFAEYRRDSKFQYQTRIAICKSFLYRAIHEESEIYRHSSEALNLSAEEMSKLLKCDEALMSYRFDQLLIISSNKKKDDDTHGIPLDMSLRLPVKEKRIPNTRDHPGKTTEALIALYLAEQDRELASILFERVLGHPSIPKEDVLRIKALFKGYGRCFDEKDDDPAKVARRLRALLLLYVTNI